MPASLRLKLALISLSLFFFSACGLTKSIFGGSDSSDGKNKERETTNSGSEQLGGNYAYRYGVDYSKVAFYRDSTNQLYVVGAAGAVRDIETLEGVPARVAFGTMQLQNVPQLISSSVDREEVVSLIQSQVIQAQSDGSFSCPIPGMPPLQVVPVVLATDRLVEEGQFKLTIFEAEAAAGPRETATSCIPPSGPSPSVCEWKNANVP